VAADPVTRQAARVATLVALPLVAVVAAGSVWYFGARSGGSPAPSSGPSSGHRPTATATATVTLPATALPEAAAQVCRQVVAALPATVGARARRPVTGGAQNAAWGDPPVTFACGAPAPSVAPAQDLTQLSGVCWATTVAGDHTSWSTVDRQVPVQVTVPGPAAGSAQVTIAFSAAIDRNDPVAEHVPTGCRG
jgi:hypothetical protein